MEYGLLGEKLGHSFSKEIHEALGKYQYDLCEVSQDHFDEFMKNKDFKAINVTIPYKEKVIPYLSYIDDTAKKIGAVNTIVNVDGQLHGYNTDYYGVLDLIKQLDLNVEGKTALILGTGGTSKTTKAVLEDLKIGKVYFVSRKKTDCTITYAECCNYYNDIDIIVNTTPVGMYPNNDELILDIDNFNKLEAVIDVIYNPIKTKITQAAEKKNIKTINGLYMLVAQAVHASSIFLNEEYNELNTKEIYQKIYKDKRNIVLIGMPSCGKSTIGKYLSEHMNKEFFDTDKLIVDKINMSIKEYIELYQEDAFREIETEVIKEISKRNNLVISTGGGVIKKEINMDYLSQNGEVIFIDRDLEYLKPTESRPLSNNWDDMKKLYEERYPIYNKYASYIQKNNYDPFELAAVELYEHLK